MSVDWIGYGYAAVIASGGLVGYVKARKCFTVNLKIDTSQNYPFTMCCGSDEIHMPCLFSVSQKYQAAFVIPLG